MSLCITTAKSELAISRQYIFASFFGLDLFATLSKPEGSPMWEASRWEIGSGWRFLVGPLLVDIGKARA